MAEEKRVVKQIAKGDNVTQVAGDQVVIFPEDAQSAFDEAVQLINNGKPEAAQVLLERTWRYRNDTMRAQQKANCRRLIGCALERQDRYEEAGRYFIEAKELDPTWEKARAFEAVGYLCLRNPEKAHTVAEEVLQEFSQNNVAWSIWIQTAPDTLCFSAIQAKVPSHLQGDEEIVMALAIAAAARGDLETAEELASPVQKRMPDNARVTERFANLLFQRAAISEQVHTQRGASEEERSLVQRARGLYSDALRKWQEEGSTKGIIRVRLARAWTYAALLEPDRARVDAEAAYELGSKDPEVAYSYAAFVGNRDLSTAIEALENVVGKDAKPDVEHLLAQMLFKRNHACDRGRALALLKCRLKDLCSIPESARFEYIDCMLEMEAELSGQQCANTTLNDVPGHVISDRFRGILQGKLLWLAGKKEEALRIAKDLYDTLDTSTTLEERRRLATLLQFIGLHREALRIWKSVVRTDCIGTDTYKLIDCAKHSGADSEVLEVAAALRQNKIWEKNIFEYEIYLRQKYNDWKQCKTILAEYITAPLDAQYLPYARALLSHVAAVLGEVALIETDVSLLPSPDNVAPELGRLIVQSLRLAGEPLKAVDYAYELVRSHFDSLEAHLTMASLMVPLGPKQPEMQSLHNVGPGAAVQYKEDGAHAPVWHVIEDSKGPVPDASRNEYPTDHPYSERMLNLKKSDTFLLRGGEIQERRATILRVLSKYDYRIGVCMDEFEDRFPGTQIIVKINPYREDGQIDLDPIQRLACIGETQTRESLRSYREQRVPIYLFAASIGKDLLEALGYLLGLPDAEIYCRQGHPSETEAALRGMKKATEIVLDEVALATLLFSDCCGHLAKIPKKLVVSQGTLLNIEHWNVTHMDPNNPGMSAGTVNSKLVVAPRSKEEVERLQAKIRTLLAFIREHCIIESGVALTFFESSQRELLTRVFGEACAETLAISREARRVLWTDDLTCGTLHSQEFGGTRVWTQLVFEYLAHLGLIDQDVLKKVVRYLVSGRYWFTSINAEMAVAAVAESNWDTNSPPLREVLRHFGDTRVTFDANVMLIIARLLKYCWTQDQLGLRASGVTIRILRELAKRPEAPIAILVKALWISIQREFGVDVLTARQVRGVLQNWLDGQGGRIPRL